MTVMTEIESGQNSLFVIQMAFSVKINVSDPAPCFLMARKLRVQYPGAIYHVMSRGDHLDQTLPIPTCGRDWTTEYSPLATAPSMSCGEPSACSIATAARAYFTADAGWLTMNLLTAG